MRLAVSINGKRGPVASAPLRGYLSAHLNLSVDTGPEAQPDRLWMSSIDTSGTVSTTHASWDAGTILEGDTVEVRLLPDGAFDPPNETRITTDNPGNLLENEDLAKELLALVKVFDGQLEAFLQKAQLIESTEEFRKLARAVCSVSVETERELILPVLRRHTGLIPDDRKDGWI